MVEMFSSFFLDFWNCKSTNFIQYARKNEIKVLKKIVKVVKYNMIKMTQKKTLR